MFSYKSLESGVQIEQEHKRTYIWLSNYIKKHRKMPPPVELYLSIAKDHLLEDGQYYEKIKDAGL